MRLHVPSSSAETQREIQSTELGAISVCVCCSTVGKSSDLDMRGRCVGGARVVRGRCVGDAWEVRGRCVGDARVVPAGVQGLCVMGSRGAAW